MNSRTRRRRTPASGDLGPYARRTIMPIPQVNDRIKEAPVVVLRAVFAGIGQLLLTADKVRTRAAEQVWTPDQPAGAGPAGPSPNWAATATKTAPATKATVTTKAAPSSKAAPPAKPAPAAPPLPGYDDLSLPSLRARLRTLDATAIKAMLDYEKARARRDEVITMLERRLAKITAE